MGEWGIEERDVIDTLSKIVDKARCLGVTIMMPPTMLEQYHEDTGARIDNMHSMDLLALQVQMLHPTGEPGIGKEIEVLLLPHNVRALARGMLGWLQVMHEAGRCDCGQHG